MLQIRLSKGGQSAEGGGGGGGGAAKPSVPSETVTVACPDHLVIADLAVAKSIGAVPSSTATGVVKSVGRRSRRHLGERVHFCVCCDFPIAIYGRLIPCEHAFCLTCARSDSSCYLCDERIQKIQTIKMMEGIFICAAPHCLKSFLKRSEFESHVQEVHADLLQPDMEREGANETDAINTIRPSSTDSHLKQSLQPEISTARGPSRPGFSPSSNSQLQDREDWGRRNQSREQTPMRPPQQPMPLPFHGRQQHQLAESQPDNNQPPQGIWFQQSQSFENQSGALQRWDSDQSMSDKPTGLPPESPFPDYPPSLPFQLPNYPVPVVMNQVLNPSPQFSYPPFPIDGSQPYYNTPFEMPRPEMMPVMPEGGKEQGSLLGFPPASAGVAGFPDNYPHQWNNAGFVNMQFEHMPVAQGNPEGLANPPDGHGRTPFFQGEYGRTSEALQPNPPHLVREPEMQGGSADQNDRKGMLASQQAPLHLPLSLPPPPPLPPPSMSQQHRHGSFSGPSDGSDGSGPQGYGWQNDNSRGFRNGPD